MGGKLKILKVTFKSGEIINFYPYFVQLGNFVMISMRRNCHVLMSCFSLPASCLFDWGYTKTLFLTESQKQNEFCTCRDIKMKNMLLTHYCTTLSNIVCNYCSYITDFTLNHYLYLFSRAVIISDFCRSRIAC